MYKLFINLNIEEMTNPLQREEEEFKKILFIVDKKKKTNKSFNFLKMNLISY